MLFIADQTIEQGLSFEAGRPDVELKNSPTSLAVWRRLREDTNACISCGSHNGAPYLALPTSRMIGLEDKPASENAGKADCAVCAHDCDDLNAVYYPTKGRCYFLYRENGGKTGVVFQPMLPTVRNSRVGTPRRIRISACNDELNRRADHGERLR